MKRIPGGKGGIIVQAEKGETANPNGRPKKRYSEHIADIKKLGYVAPTKSEYFEMMGLLLAMNEEDLKEFTANKERPYWVRLIIADLNNKQIRAKIQSDYRDWLFGTATRQIDMKAEIADIKKTVNDLFPLELKEYYNTNKDERVSEDTD